MEDTKNPEKSTNDTITRKIAADEVDETESLSSEIKEKNQRKYSSDDEKVCSLNLPATRAKSFSVGHNSRVLSSSTPDVALRREEMKDFKKEKELDRKKETAIISRKKLTTNPSTLSSNSSNPTSPVNSRPSSGNPLNSSPLSGNSQIPRPLSGNTIVNAISKSKSGNTPPLSTSPPAQSSQFLDNEETNTKRVDNDFIQRKSSSVENFKSNNDPLAKENSEHESSKNSSLVNGIGNLFTRSSSKDLSGNK